MACFVTFRFDYNGVVVEVEIHWSFAFTCYDFFGARVLSKRFRLAHYNNVFLVNIHNCLYDEEVNGRNE